MWAPARAHPWIYANRSLALIEISNVIRGHLIFLAHHITIPTHFGRSPKKSSWRPRGDRGGGGCVVKLTFFIALSYHRSVSGRLCTFTLQALPIMCRSPASNAATARTRHVRDIVLFCAARPLSCASFRFIWSVLQHHNIRSVPVPVGVPREQKFVGLIHVHIRSH